MYKIKMRIANGEWKDMGNPHKTWASARDERIILKKNTKNLLRIEKVSV